MVNRKDLEFYMRRALELAQNGRFRASPNPATGAVLVKNGEIVASGWHKKAGEDHAEIACLKHALSRGIDPAGALIAVTLEPCVHQGRTPPCADALLAAKIGALAYGAPDPNPLAKGGAAKLAAAGIAVFGPILEQECKDLIADFTVWQTSCRPYVILKLAASLDGRIATSNGDSRWISCEESRLTTHAMRALTGEAGGIVLIGGETFRQDNPALTSRGLSCAKQPLAGIVTSHLPKPDCAARLLDERPGETVFFTTPQTADSSSASLLREKGCRVFPVAKDPSGKMNLEELLRIIREDLSCLYVFCEGGGKLALSLLEQGLVDEFHLHLAPIILGDEKAKPLFAGKSLTALSQALRLRFCESRFNGDDINLLLRPLP